MAVIMLKALSYLLQRITFIVLWGSMLAGCASGGLRQADDDGLLQALIGKSDYGMVSDRDVLALPEQARDFLRRAIPGHLPPEARFNRLVALFSEGRALTLTYRPDITRTAAETFLQKQGNCLSFTQLFLAMARELGLHARFQEIDVRPDWDRNGDLLTVYRHVAVFVRVEGRIHHIDFGRVMAGFPSMGAIIDDRRARGQYFNNHGVHALIDGRPEQAIAHFYRALLLAPEVSFVWSNLGVALTRVQRDNDAELALRRALSLDSGQKAALISLNKLYARTGRGWMMEEKMNRQISKYQQRNPYYHYELGKQALVEQRYEDARTHFVRAIRRKKDEPFFHYHLAQSWLHLGRPRKALDSYKTMSSIVKDKDQLVYLDNQFRNYVKKNFEGLRESG